ncbi:MAG: aminopeptidase, partial [Candidatus Blackburnbacteria bacterium]|nr:aminopeptidase [Candidatus Blackburnbacteria bacterium]
MKKIITREQSTELAEFDPRRVAKIARDMTNQAAKIKRGERVMIHYDPAGRQLALEIAKLCIKKGCKIWFRVNDTDMDATLLSGLSERDIARYTEFLAHEIFGADAYFAIRAPRDPVALGTVPAENMAIFTRNSEYTRDFRVNYTNWQLIYLPTEAEAKIEEMSLEEYAQLFFAACNRPWKKIREAQNKLVKILDKGKELILVADPKSKDLKKRTRLKMSIEGMQFVNLTIDRNYPGSEVFSSPVRDTVNGQLFAAGKYIYEGRIMEDIYLQVENGKIIAAQARKGEKELINILDRDEGARYFGEVALGTNRALARRLFNPLLNEKVGGSFHITPGKAYEFEEYEG